MTGYDIFDIDDQDAAAQAALLELNNEHALQTSYLTAQKWHSLIDGSFSATCTDSASALLIAFDQDGDYNSENFKWICARYPRFVYVDRIIVSVDHQGAGLARRLYSDLFDRSLAAGQTVVTCEVNVVPANPGSDAFHEKMGFAEVGRAEREQGKKTVRYLEKRLN
jgi:hypothetical protein